MKPAAHITRFLFGILCIATLSTCSSDDDTSEPTCEGVDCLPAATQRGARTFGCLVNGEPFVVNGLTRTYYQDINLVEKSFVITARFEDRIPRALGLSSGIISNQLQVGNYIIELNSNGNFEADLNFLRDFPIDVSSTTDEIYTGVFRITKLDEINQIISGTFEFEVLRPDTNEVYRITDGRFDTVYMD